MKQNKMNLLKQTAIKNGLLIWLLLGFYFLLIDSLGYSDIAYLKIFNIMAILLGVNMTLKHYAKKGAHFGMLIRKGLQTAFIGVGLAIVGLLVYFEILLGGVDIASYSTTLIPTSSLSQYVFALFAEGISSAVIVVFVLLQFWKNYAEKQQALFEEKL
jgi:hypothetical protein